MDDEESIAEVEDLVEPDVTSSNPEIRMLARRMRIQRRAEAIAKQQAAAAELQAQQEVEHKDPIKVQMEKSSDVIEKLMIEGEEYITNVRIASEAREADRRESEGFGREDIIKALEEEAAAAQDMFEEIAGRWAETLKYNDPLHINEDITSQKEKCDELIKQKDEVIAMLRNELKKAEINFDVDQRKQMEDINSLAKRIEKQMVIMRKAHRDELELIEKVIMSERQNMIENNDKRWEDLAKQRDSAENANSIMLEEEMDKFMDAMTQLRHDFEEQFRDIKIRMENNCEELERELEKIKTQAVVNSEKLDYNYQILKKREDENLVIKSQQKRRLNKLQDVINSLRRKISAYHHETQEGMKKCTRDIKILQRNILDIESKADHFAKANDIKFKRIWEMNKGRADEILNKIIVTDRILYEQQLGIPWKELESKLYRKKDLLSYNKAVTVMASVNRVPKKKITEMSDHDIEELDREDRERESVIYRRIMKTLMEKISDKSDFLIEDHLKVILEPYTESEKCLVRVDNIFCALQVDRKEDIGILLRYFVPYMYCPVCTTVCTSISEEEPEEEMEVHELDDETPKNTRVFSEDESSSSSSSDSSGLTSGEGGSDGGTLDEEKGEEETESDHISLVAPLNLEPVNDDLEGECKGPPVIESNEGETQDNEDQSKEFVLREKTSCQYEHPLVISSVYVLKALKEFLADYHVEKAGVPTMGSRVYFKRYTTSRLVEEADIEKYWRRFTEIFTGDREQLWDCLLEGLKKYLELLRARKQISQEVVNLRKQNKELRRVFANYSYMDSTL